MEPPRNMLLHSAIISTASYVVMLYMLKKSQSQSEKHSLVIGAVSLLYMIQFGHGLPKL